MESYTKVGDFHSVVDFLSQDLSHYLKFTTLRRRLIENTRCKSYQNNCGSLSKSSAEQYFCRFPIYLCPLFSKRVLVLLLSYDNELSFTRKLNSFSYKWSSSKPRFEKEARVNLAMAYCCPFNTTFDLDADHVNTTVHNFGCLVKKIIAKF